MLEIHYLNVLVTAVVAFVMSSVWYTVFGEARMKLLDQDPRATADMRKVPALCRYGATLLHCRSPFYLGFEHVDNLGAYSVSRPETGLLISCVNLLPPGA